MKNKIARRLNKYINTETIKMLILFVPLVYLLAKQVSEGSFALEDFLDSGILVSFLLVAICEAIAYLLGSYIGRKCEDSTKLTEDYKQLCKKYAREKFVLLGEEKCPVICLALRKKTDKPFEIEICENEERMKYELPSQVADKSDTIMEAHKYSTVYNSRNIRLDDLTLDGGRVSLLYSTTMYFDSLVTNRAMDYDWGNGKTIREVYEPGPFLNSLRESKLSNHLGFNGFVETSDGKIVFVKRFGKVSIGKDTLANSIGASLKTKYCLDDDKKFTLSGLDKAIACEIKDELEIKINPVKDLHKSIFAFYRDVVEGGKPQFLFYHKVDLTFAEIEKAFEESLKKDKKKKKALVADGKKLIPIAVEDLKSIKLAAGSLTLKSGKKYKMMPSAVASVKLLLEYLEIEY